MILEGSVEALNELLEGSVLFGLGIKVLETNNLFMLNRLGIISLGINEMNASWIRRVSVADKGYLLISRSSPDGFIHSDNGRLSAPVVGHVIRGDFQALGRDKEEDIMVLAQDLDVGLITGRDIIDMAFVFEIESVAVPSGASGIIENGLMRNLDTEDFAQDLSSFSGRNGERNIEGQNQAKHVFAVMDSRQLDRRFVWR